MGESASTVVKTNTASTRTSGGNYIVQPGDTLYSIARRSGMSLNTLLSINGLSQSSIIFPGQSLTVGQSDGRTVSADTHHLKQQRLQHQLLEHIQFKQVIPYTVSLVVQE